VGDGGAGAEGGTVAGGGAGHEAVGAGGGGAAEDHAPVGSQGVADHQAGLGGGGEAGQGLDLDLHVEVAGLPLIDVAEAVGGAANVGPAGGHVVSLTLGDGCGVADGRR